METEKQVTEEVIDKAELAIIKTDGDTQALKIVTKEDLLDLEKDLEDLAKMKRRLTLKKLTVTDINDKAAVERLRIAVGEARTKRTSLNKKRLDKGKPYTETKNFIDKNYNRVITIASSIEDPISNHYDEVREKIDAQKQQEEVDRQKRIQERVAILIQSGAEFDGVYYSVGSEEFGVSNISLDIATIQGASDDIFESMLSQVIEKRGIISEKEAEKAEAKRKQIEADRQREEEEKKKFNEAQEALQKERELFLKQQDDFKKQQEEFQEQQNKLRQQKEESEKNLIRVRLADLIQVGWNGQFAFDKTTPETPLATYEELVSFSDASFYELRDIYNKAVSARIDEENKKREEAKKAEEKRISDKAIEDKKLQDELNEKARVEELEKQGDLAKWDDFIIRLKAITYPEMKSKSIGKKVNEVKIFIDNLK